MNIKSLLTITLFTGLTCGISCATNTLPNFLQQSEETENVNISARMETLLAEYESNPEELPAIHDVFLILISACEESTDMPQEALIFNELLKKTATFIEARIQRGNTTSATTQETTARQEVMDFCNKHEKMFNQ